MFGGIKSQVQSQEKGSGAGNRGGNWNNGTSNSRVSDRNNAANVNSNRNNNNGGRCVRTSLETPRASVRRRNTAGGKPVEDEQARKTNYEKA